MKSHHESSLDSMSDSKKTIWFWLNRSLCKKKGRKIVQKNVQADTNITTFRIIKYNKTKVLRVGSRERKKIKAKNQSNLITFIFHKITTQEIRTGRKWFIRPFPQDAKIPTKKNIERQIARHRSRKKSLSFG